MKFLKVILIAFAVLFILLYILLFTKIGNKLLKPYIENSLRKNSGIEAISLTSFSLKPTVFNLAGEAESISFIVDGKYSIFKASAEGAYRIDIKNLSDLKRLLDLDIRIIGDYFGTGSFAGDKKRMIINGKGKLDGIDIDYKAGLDKGSPSALDIGIYNANFKKLLHMLDKSSYYIFDASFDADIRHDFKTEKTEFQAVSEKGKFVTNKLINSILRLAGLDITREIYKNVELKGNIDKKIVTADLDMVSGKTKITAKDTVIDIEKNTINALLDINIEDTPLEISVKGAIDNPNINIDASKYIEKNIEKHVEKLIEDENNHIKGFLKKLF